MPSTVITIVAGRHEHLREQRRGLARSGVTVARHVVVSMGDDAVADVLADDASIPTTLVRIPVPSAGLPLAAARNAGAAAVSASDGDLLIFLDVDCVPDELLVQRYERAARRRADAVLCGPVTYLPPTADPRWTQARLAAARSPHPARPDPPADDLVPADPTLFWSLSFALTTQTWRRTGGFYEGYVGYGGEDTDFARCASAAGVPVLWVGGADAYHQHHGTGAGPLEHVDDILRNGAVFAGRHGEWPMGGWLDSLAADGLVRRGPEGWRRTDAVRVASVPHSHPYVDAVTPPTVQPVLTERSSGWEPDPIWDAGWLGAHLDDVDVVHVHFGFEQVPLPSLARWLTTLREHSVPLVVTVHDLRSPHEPSPAEHHLRLGALVAAAAHVFTLTDGAARECERRFGRRPEVAAHPPFARGHRDLVVEPSGGVLLPLKALRANVIDPLDCVRAVVRATPPDVPVRVLLHPVEHRREEVQQLRDDAARGGFVLDVRPYLDAGKLESLVSEAHAVVLPYRFGTHSGWVELCHDLGTPMVAPDCGYYAEQWEAAEVYTGNETDGLDAASLGAAVGRALAAPRPRPADRSAVRDKVRAAHDSCYRSVSAR